MSNGQAYGLTILVGHQLGISAAYKDEAMKLINKEPVAIPQWDG